MVHDDAFRWLRGAVGEARGTYGVIVADLPDPGVTTSSRLYSEEFYGLAARALAGGGRLVVHAGSLRDRPHTYWTVEATLRAAGFATRPYGTDDGRSGFVLAAPARHGGARPPGAGPGARRTGAGACRRPGALAAGAARAERSRVPGLPPSTLVHPGTATDAGFGRRACADRGRKGRAWVGSIPMEHEVFVPVAVQTLRDLLADPARVASCVPGLHQMRRRRPRRCRAASRCASAGTASRTGAPLRVAARDDGSYAVEGEGEEVRGTGRASTSR